MTKRIGILVIVAILTLTIGMTYAMAEKIFTGSEQLYSNIPIYNENNEKTGTRKENNDTIYYTYSTDQTSSVSMRVGTVNSKKVVLGYSTGSGYARLEVSYTSHHSEKGYCPSWSNTISYYGEVPYTGKFYKSNGY